MQKKWILLIIILIVIGIVVISIGYSVYSILGVETEEKDQSYDEKNIDIEDKAW